MVVAKFATTTRDGAVEANLAEEFNTHPALDNAESNRWRVNMNIGIEIDEL